MCPHVPLQLVGVSAGVAAKAALEGPLPRVGPDVSFQLAHLDKGGHVVKKQPTQELPKIVCRPRHTSNSLPPRCSSRT